MATNTHSEDAIFFCFSTATMVARTGLDITLEYNDCLVFLHQENETLFHKSEYCDRKDIITSAF